MNGSFELRYENSLLMRSEQAARQAHAASRVGSPGSGNVPRI